MFDPKHLCDRVKIKPQCIEKVCRVSSQYLQNTLKKLGVNAIQGIEEVNMIKDDGYVLHFVSPKGE